VAVVGVPFDSGTTFRPGARFGPIAVRQASRLLRPYHPALDVLPFETLQVADAGDITCNPFDIQESLAQIEAGVDALYGSSESFVAIGGDHTIALPLLRAVKKQKGARLALLHFDAHLDTFDTYFGAAYTHGTPFRRAFEEGLLVEDRSMHVGIRGPLYSSRDLTDDESFGFRIITAMDFETQTLAEIVDRVRTRIGDAPLYVSIDIDVLDPGAAPGTGTPEAGGLTSRELLGVLRGLRGLSLAAADVVEVAPAYDHAEVTSMAASHVVYELISLLALQRTGPRPGR
jgi:agmatinase